MDEIEIVKALIVVAQEQQAATKAALSDLTKAVADLKGAGAGIVTSVSDQVSGQVGTAVSKKIDGMGFTDLETAIKSSTSELRGAEAAISKASSSMSWKIWIGTGLAGAAIVVITFICATYYFPSPADVSKLNAEAAQLRVTINGLLSEQQAIKQHTRELRVKEADAAARASDRTRERADDQSSDHAYYPPGQ